MSDEKIIELWKRELTLAECIESFFIESDKLIDFSLTEKYNCKLCKSSFCFITMQWDDDQELDYMQIPDDNMDKRFLVGYS